MAKNTGKRAFLSFVFGGLLPMVAFTVIEERYGTVWGVVAGMVFGVGEIIWELVTVRRVSWITLGGNALILLLGAISLKANEGIWFKLQPAIMEAVIAVLLIVSCLFKKPILIVMAEKQGQALKPEMKAFFSGLTLRIGIFFGAHAVLATWAAYSWSTTAWALLKGVGFTVSFFVYMGLEIVWRRRKSVSARK